MGRLFQAGYQFTDGTLGRPVVSGSLVFSASGTSTAKAVYSDSALSTSSGSTVNLDSEGRTSSEVFGTGVYRVKLYSAANGTGTVHWTKDDVRPINGNDLVSVLSYGATADGATDDYAAIRSALDAVEAAGGGTLYFPRGSYAMSEPLEVTGNSVSFVGDGAFQYFTTIASHDNAATNLIATHNDGAVVRVSGHNFSMRDMNLCSDATRYAGASNSGTSTVCAGLHIEGPDASGGSGASHNHCIERVAIGFQPYHGLLMVSSHASSSLRNVAAIGNLGHGICFDRGRETNRTNKSDPGMVTLNDCRAHDNAGHGLCAGHPLDAGSLGSYRLHVENLETYRNASDASVRHAAYGVWANGQNNVFEQCAFGIYPASDTSVGGLCIGGRVNRVRNCRWLSHVQPVSVIEVASDTTRDIEFTGMMFSLSTTPVAYAVLVASGCQNVRAHAAFDQRGSDTQYTALLQPNFQGYEIIEADGIRSDYTAEYRGFSSTPTFTIADDAVQTLEFQTKAGAAGTTGGLLAFACQAQAQAGGLVAYRVGSTPYVTTLGVGSAVAATTGVLAGTTGTDGKLTISAHTDGYVYIENRLGGTITISCTILSNTSGQLATYF